MCGARNARCVVLLLLGVVAGASGYFNFYLSLSEVHRLLGFEMELFYVRNGTVKDNAVQFVIPVPSKVDALHFTWESLAGRPLPYSIGVDVSDGAAIAHPKLNVTPTGSVPTALQTFSVSLPCTGAVSTDVTVTIQVNVSAPHAPPNATSLTLHRRKGCARVDTRLGSHVHVDALLRPRSSARIFYAAVGCAAALAALVVGAGLVGCCVRARLLRRRGKPPQAHAAYDPTPAAANPTYGSCRRMPPSCAPADERARDLRERIAALTVRRRGVRLTSVLLEGTFGRVYLGAHTTDAGDEVAVVVKTATDHASQTQISLLLQEGMAMYSLRHRCIQTILGVSIEDNTPPYLLYPYDNYGNMKVFLQTCKGSVEGVAHALTTQEVVDMALQVIEAIQYLHKKHLLHKDVAARNCIIDDKLQVKIADNALARDLFPSDYHCLGDNENRPVKWLALESLLHKAFSASSDVWAFGVLLWELTTLAQQPYVEIDPFEMAAYLRDGYRLAQPINCPDELFAVMAYCWAMSAEERPTISQLRVCLHDFYAQLTRYV